MKLEKGKVYRISYTVTEHKKGNFPLFLPDQFSGTIDNITLFEIDKENVLNETLKTKHIKRELEKIFEGPMERIRKLEIENDEMRRCLVDDHHETGFKKEIWNDSVGFQSDKGWTKDD